MNPPPTGHRTSVQPVAASPQPVPADPKRRPDGRIRRLATRIGAAVRIAHSAAVPF